MLNDIQINTGRLILKSITPAVINNLFKMKTKKGIISFFGIDEQGYEHYKSMHEKEWKLIVCLFFLLIDKQTNLPIAIAVFIHGTKHVRGKSGFIKEGTMRENYIFNGTHEDSDYVIRKLKELKIY